MADIDMIYEPRLSALQAPLPEFVIPDNTSYHYIENGNTTVRQAYFLMQWFRRIQQRLVRVDKWTQPIRDKWNGMLKQWIHELTSMYTTSLIGDREQDLTKRPNTTTIYEDFFALMIHDDYRWNRYNANAFTVLWDVATSCEFDITYQESEAKRKYGRNWKPNHTRFLDNVSFMDDYKQKRVPHIYDKVPGNVSRYVEQAFGLGVIRHTEDEKQLVRQQARSKDVVMTPSTMTSLSSSAIPSSSTASTDSSAGTIQTKSMVGKPETKTVERVDTDILLATLGEVGELVLPAKDRDRDPLDDKETTQYNRVVSSLTNGQVQGLWAGDEKDPTLHVAISAKKLAKLRLPSAIQELDKEQDDYLWLDHNLMNLGMSILEETIVPANWDAGYILLDDMLTERQGKSDDAHFRHRNNMVRDQLKRAKQRWPNVRNISRVFIILQNTAKTHWFLAEISVQPKVPSRDTSIPLASDTPTIGRIAIYDSMAGRFGIPYRELCSTLKEWYEIWCMGLNTPEEEQVYTEWPSLLAATTWSLDFYIPKTNPEDFLEQQTDSMSCGLIVLKYLEYRLRSLPLLVPSTSMSIFRQRLLLNAARLIVRKRRREG